jgi:predicted cupin superfamily sugar epimerase
VKPADARNHRASLTTIYFLLTDGAVSRWHQVDSDEVWHLYEGGQLEDLELRDPGQGVVIHRLGPVGEPSMQPVCTIAAGRWQAARPLAPYALVGCTVGPGFDFADFRLLADDPLFSEAIRSPLPELSDLI